MRRLVFGIGAAILLSAGLTRAAGPDVSMLADFEDVGTWRARPLSGVPPNGWFSGNMVLASSAREKLHGDWVGEIRYTFDGAGPFRMTLEREKMSRLSAFLKAIVFDANPKGNACTLAFEIEDSTKAKFQTVPIPLRGDAWQTYRLDLNAETVPGFAKIRFPAVLRRIFFSTEKPGEGSVFLDDLRVEGRVSTANKLRIRPVYEGIAYAPEQPVTLAYRVRNASAEPAGGEAVLRIEDVAAHAPRELRKAFQAAGGGETEVRFETEALPVGAYAARLTVTTDVSASDYLDFFGVFTPNGRRLNHEPMWFGVQDFTTWQGEAESALHLEWMKALGVDLTRVGMVGDWLEPRRGEFTNPPLARMLGQLAAGQIDVLLLYSDAVPSWTQSTPAWRKAPTDWDAFQEHGRDVGRFLATQPNVRYLEFWNEPDLEFFSGTLPEYLEMLRRFGAGFRESAPNIQLVSGGVTVRHPAEKQGFSEGVISQTGLFDVAGFHSHGSVSDYALRNDLVEKWMSPAEVQRPFGNTEAGYRSGYEAPGALTQAVTLTQKITEAKSRPRSQFYIWFTLQDYWDMDAKADDSLGLVTSDNRVKPSFVAYNELIRRLANTEPLGRVTLQEDVAAYAFRRKEDGAIVYVLWPEGGRSSARFWVKSGAPYQRFDLFGREGVGLPGEASLLSLSRLPVFLQSTKADDKLEPAASAESFFEVPEILEAADVAPVRIRNIWGDKITGSVRLKTARGEGMPQTFALDPKADCVLTLSLPQPVSENYKTAGVTVEIRIAGSAERQVSLPVEVRTPYPVGSLKQRPLAEAPAIRLDQPEDVHELAYDPFRPAWGGPDELSVTARLAHDGKALFLSFDVTDATHVQNEKESAMWMGDSVQVATLSPEGKFSEFTLGLRSSGPAVWFTESASGLKGHADLPFTAVREGRKTKYEVQVPLADLGLDYQGKLLPFRLAFVLNNNDGSGRVRYLQWFDGMALRKDPKEFGFAILQ